MSKYFLFIFIVYWINTCWGSIGDRSNVFVSCLEVCTKKKCVGETFLKEQFVLMKWMGWDCMSECKHSCMWDAVRVFEQHSVPTPQFYGKWPFIRIFGIQEPASVIFSIMNGISNMIGFQRYRARVPKSAPMYGMATLQVVVGLNAWLWSVVFHCRDLPWTERLDYFCATSLIVFHLFYALYRWSYEFSPSKRKPLRLVSGYVIFLLYLMHILYLSFKKFDYGYNIQANIACGMLNSLSWIVLCFYKRKTHSYFFKIVAMILLTYIFLSFEIFDFPPLFWTLDAHSLWHLLTVPMPLLFYSFCADDSIALLKSTSID